MLVLDHDHHDPVRLDHQLLEILLDLRSTWDPGDQRSESVKGRGLVGWLVGCLYIPEDPWMYGLFTYTLGYKWPHSRRNGLVNIPVRWILWVCLEDVSCFSVVGYFQWLYHDDFCPRVQILGWSNKVGDKVWSRLESSGWSQLPSRDYPKNSRRSSQNPGNYGEEVVVFVFYMFLPWYVPIVVVLEEKINKSRTIVVVVFVETKKEFKRFFLWVALGLFD